MSNFELRVLAVLALFLALAISAYIASNDHDIETLQREVKELQQYQSK